MTLFLILKQHADLLSSVFSYGFYRFFSFLDSSLFISFAPHAEPWGKCSKYFIHTHLLSPHSHPLNPLLKAPLSSPRPLTMISYPPSDHDELQGDHSCDVLSSHTISSTLTHTNPKYSTRNHKPDLRSAWSKKKRKESGFCSCLVLHEND